MTAFSSWGRFFRNRNQQSNGTSVSEKSSEPTSAEVTVHAIGAKIRPSWRCNVKIGMCATMMMSMEKNVGRPTSAAAFRTRSRTLLRSVEWSCSESFRKMFSITITAPSTMMPKSIAPRESRLAGMPRHVRPMNVASSDSGIISATMNAARRLPRNSSSTNVTSIAPSARFLKTVCSVVSISQEFLRLARALLAPVVGNRHAMEEHLLSENESKDFSGMDLVFCDTAAHHSIRETYYNCSGGL